MSGLAELSRLDRSVVLQACGSRFSGHACHRSRKDDAYGVVMARKWRYERSNYITSVSHPTWPLVQKKTPLFLLTPCCRKKTQICQLRHRLLALGVVDLKKPAEVFAAVIDRPLCLPLEIHSCLRSVRHDDANVASSPSNLFRPNSDP
jgi:hypothetical protein